MKTNTSGVFAVEANGEEIYVGASSQVEVAFRDYMGWIKKNKAPKAIQSFADELLAQGKELPEVIEAFDYNVVIECDDKSRLKELRKMYKQMGSTDIPDVAPVQQEESERGDEEIQAIVQQLNTPEPTPSSEKVEETEEVEMTVEERNAKILDRIAAGTSVKAISEEFGVSKSTVYNVKNGR